VPEGLSNQDKADNLRIEDQADKPTEQKAPETKEPKFDPSTDLNIFEQFNFDEMNINFEDIHHNHNQEGQGPNSSSELSREAAPDHGVDTEPNNTSSDQDPIDKEDLVVQDKFKEMAQIGTELEVIESNDISASKDSQFVSETSDKLAHKPYKTTDGGKTSQDKLLEQLQQKNTQTLEHIKHEVK